MSQDKDWESYRECVLPVIVSQGEPQGDPDDTWQEWAEQVLPC